MAALATLLLVPAAPVSAVFMTNYTIAEASWTSEPVSGPVPHVVYSGTYINANNALYVRGTGPVDPRPALSIYKFDYYVDDIGNQIIISDWGAFAIGNQVRLSINSGNLSSASASGTVTATACTYASDGTPTCAPAGTGFLAAAWTGEGAVIHAATPFHAVTRQFTLVEGGSTSFRNASVAATFNGVDVGLGQRLVYADIYHSIGATTFTCHQPNAC